MAIYTTFFLCKPQDLRAGFPGWRPPLPAPVERTLKNPFTGQMVTVVTREPEWLEEEVAQPAGPSNDGWLSKLPAPAAVRGCLMMLVQWFSGFRPLPGGYRVVTVTGSYADNLENRLYPFVRERPHLARKGITEVELEPLCRAAGIEVEFEYPLYAPPLFAVSLLLVPRGLLSNLVQADAAGVETIASRWAEIMSTHEYTHSVAGNRISDGWPTEEAMDILDPILNLARQMEEEDEMYLLIEA